MSGIWKTRSVQRGTLLSDRFEIQINMDLLGCYKSKYIRAKQLDSSKKCQHILNLKFKTFEFV